MNRRAGTAHFGCNRTVSLYFFSRVHLLILAAAVLAILPRGRTAHAQEPEPSRPTAAIVITFDPNAVQEERVVAAVKAHLSGLPVRVLVRPLIRSGSVGQNVARAGALATASAALGTSSIEVGDDGAFLIYFTEPGGESTLIRRLPPNDEGVRVTVEEASIVVRSLVLALLEGRRIGMAKPADARADAERPRKGQPPPQKRKDERSSPSKRAAPPPNAEDPPSAVNSPAEDATGSAAGEDGWRASGSDSVVAVTAGYAGTHFATNTSWQSGFTPGFRWVAFRPMYVAARYTFFPKLEGGTKETAVSVARHPGELAIGYVGSTRLAANAELGIVFDYTSRQTRSNGPGFEPTPTSRRSTLAFGARAGASFAFVPAVELALRGGADFLVTRYAYVMPDGRTVAAPHGVRPRVDVELAASLW
jgi:hypothetical protein